MRQQVREIEINVAYRWFLWLRLTDGVFDASTLSQNRRRCYNCCPRALARWDLSTWLAMPRKQPQGITSNAQYEPFPPFLYPQGDVARSE